jgi:hypothetical protein
MRSRTIPWALRAGLALAVGLAAFATGPGVGAALSDLTATDSLRTSYFDLATSAATSRAGYGGPGISGGAGDNTVRIVNPTSNLFYLIYGGKGVETIPLCAMIYVFDDFEEMQTCCGCPVTPDGMRTLSVTNDLTFDFGVNKGNLNAGVIDIVSSFPNFEFINPPPPNPPGTNGSCSPTGLFSNDPFNRAQPVDPAPGLRESITHDEVSEPGNIAGGKAVQSVSVDEFQNSPLDDIHLTDLQQRCAFIIQNGSGSGVCTCGAGDNGNFVLRKLSTVGR